ncbi:hypothetical protein [Sinorhizobium psoraleae]|uniref:Uncharacterized protein n=1 Tax=Sinorhizobium psoraleae TaxID=520838 RepID=A0ABT4KMA7_9HYPH|nr:hypothetical protein [Sinorhizobium psoraleae]MCZ4093044.1 hypothetical protein [Sinorhizobium psoraleae]
MADIRIRDLPTASPPVATDFVPLDNGTTRKTDIQTLVETGRPAASQAEAETGTDPSKAMTPLTTKQAVASYGLTKDGNLAGLTNTTTARSNLGLGSAAVEAASSFATAAQGDKADTALQPAEIGATVQAYSANLDELATVNAGTAGKAILADETPQDVRDYLDQKYPLVADKTGIVDAAAALTAAVAASDHVRIPPAPISSTPTLRSRPA